MLDDVRPGSAGAADAKPRIRHVELRIDTSAPHRAIAARPRRTGSADMSDLSPRVAREIVELARLAPSIHNTQPWHWDATSQGLELYADRSRQLAVTDPDGRELTISCGAALHHTHVAARALGWTPRVTRMPESDRPDLMARIELTPAATPHEAANLVETLQRRCTDRRRFTSWPVPPERLAHLASHATDWGSHAVALTEVSERFRTELLVNRARDLHARSAERESEQASWVDRRSPDGIPAGVLPANAMRALPGRFLPGLMTDIDDHDVESADGLIVLCASEDTPEAWLRAGEALSAIWLEATVQGLSVVPLSQVVEISETRAALSSDVLGGLAQPLMVIRVGWQAISRSQLPRTPRRAVEDLLTFSEQALGPGYAKT